MQVCGVMWVCGEWGDVLARACEVIEAYHRGSLLYSLLKTSTICMQLKYVAKTSCNQLLLIDSAVSVFLKINVC